MTPPTAAARSTSLVAVLPFACAVHCAAAPLLVLALPALAIDPAAEAVLLGLSATAGAVSTGASWRLHRKAGVWVAILLGAGVWGASLSGWLQPVPEAATDALGGALLAAGIFWSTRLAHTQRCERCTP
ncbi:MAG: MerC family mercury resistance protein [Gemmatimonadota bacterium]